jgi:hypothetical protein
MEATKLFIPLRVFCSKCGKEMEPGVHEPDPDMEEGVWRILIDPCRRCINSGIADALEDGYKLKK